MSTPTLHSNLGRTLTDIGSSSLAASVIAAALALPCVLIAWGSVALGLDGIRHSVLLTLTEGVAAVFVLGISGGIALLTGGRLLRQR